MPRVTPWRRLRWPDRRRSPARLRRRGRRRSSTCARRDDRIRVDASIGTSPMTVRPLSPRSRKPSPLATRSRTRPPAAGAAAWSQCVPSVLTINCWRVRSAALCKPMSDQLIVPSTGGVLQFASSSAPLGSPGSVVVAVASKPLARPIASCFAATHAERSISVEAVGGLLSRNVLMAGGPRRDQCVEVGIELLGQDCDRCRRAARDLYRCRATERHRRAGCAAVEGKGRVGPTLAAVV